jgi:hypothetical protein
MFGNIIRARVLLVLVDHCPPFEYGACRG